MLMTNPMTNRNLNQST